MSEPYIELSGRGVVRGVSKGVALVSPEPICFLGGVDVSTGRVTEKGHCLEGKSIAGRVLVFPIGKGSTGGSYLIYEAAANGVGPLAVVNLRAEAVTVIGCIMAGIPMVEISDPDPLSIIQEGDVVEVDGNRGVIRVWKR